jgi:hypothetical protein
VFLDPLPFHNSQEGLEIVIVPAVDLLHIHSVPISCSGREPSTVVLMC